MRVSESQLEDTNTGSPNRMAQAEENDVWMLYDMFENLLLETKDINLRARAIIDTMTDELKEKGIVRRFMRKLHAYYPEEYQTLHPNVVRDR